MFSFDYNGKWETLLSPSNVKRLISIHEFKGRKSLMCEKFHGLEEISLIQSTVYSSQLEGIKISSEREKKLVKIGKPETSTEGEIVAYRDLLLFIRKEFTFIQVNENQFLDLHQKLYKYSNDSVPSGYKDNPKYPSEITQAMASLFCSYRDNLKNVPILLLIPVVLVDFAVSSPFDHGSERMGRLLMYLLLLKADFSVVRYFSLEKYIFEHQEEYRSSLAESSQGWYENKCDYESFVSFFLAMIQSAYEDFSRQSNLVKTHSKQERVAEVIENWDGRITKANILEQCPDISDTTVQRALNALVKENIIKKVTGGRYSAYVWMREREE